MHQSMQSTSSSFAAVVDLGAYGIAAHQPGIVVGRQQVRRPRSHPSCPDRGVEAPRAILRIAPHTCVADKGATEFDGPPQPPLRESGMGTGFHR